jgi:hypothetical protein
LCQHKGPQAQTGKPIKGFGNHLFLVHLAGGFFGKSREDYFVCALREEENARIVLYYFLDNHAHSFSVGAKLKRVQKSVLDDFLMVSYSFEYF